MLDIIELEHSALTSALNEEGMLNNLILKWSALADVYGSNREESDREANRLNLLVDSAIALNALPAARLPDMDLMKRQYHIERERLALGKLRRDKSDFAHMGLALQVLREHEEMLGLRTRRQSRGAAVSERAAGARFTERLSSKQRLTFDMELTGNWRDHWRNTLP
ncbi:hypothetical protein FDW83_00605 [Pseudarthrobacter sp. NamE2]|uniref:hypothetical protein n=1 Tax=Pseudarthrobacter sp. NamE2 TaxID=2576838 RepID=UPI0010FF3B8A|nr:hypothetical protein [Pseudarthrobacter sp. NamE2]TLM86296.1 hypothetical protein FDW83_00605 [Pseudarthrobacter sp. NamE2]